jgi:hypothetical protein
MVLMVQGQMRRALREGMVELMRDALASPEPGSAAASTGFGGDAAELGGDAALPFLLGQQLEQVEQESVDGSEHGSGEGGSSSDGEAFVMVDAASSDGGSN